MGGAMMPSKTPPESVRILLLAAALVSFSFVLFGRVGLSLADEGNLWYGVIYTAQGQMPGVDFMAYDPGRYYWAVPWLTLFGTGIVGVRLSMALFQVVGLGAGLLAARRAVTNWKYLGLIGVLLLAWMFPREKLIESSVSLLAVGFATALITRPTYRRYWISGIFVGLAAFMGRNHGVYNFLAFFCLILLIQLKFGPGALFKRLGVWLSGIWVGYLPMLILLAFNSNLVTTTFKRVVGPVANKGVTNLPLPIPWLWTINYTQPDISITVIKFWVSLGFTLIPLFYLAVIFQSMFLSREKLQRRALLVASVWVGLFYMHHAFSRADLSHLAESIHPFLLGVATLPYTCAFERRRYPVTATTIFLVGLTLFAISFQTSPFLYLRRLWKQESLVPYEVAGDRLWLWQNQAAYLQAVSQFVNQSVKPEEGLLIAPYLPGLYPVLHRQSPTRHTYFLFPMTPEQQNRVINDLINHNVNWVLLANTTMDERDDLYFRYTSPQIWQYIKTHFKPVAAPGLPPDQQFLHRQ